MIVMKNFYVIVPKKGDAFLGYTGEHLSRRFEIEVDDPGAWAYKLDIRNDAGVANILDLTADGNILYTDIERAVLQVSGKVIAQIRAIDGDKVKCSNTFCLFIGDSVEATAYFETLEPSEFVQLETRLTALKTEATAAAERAEAAAEAADAAREAAEAAAAAAANDAAAAENAAESAAESKSNAESAAQRAEGARADLEQVVSDGAAVVRAEVKEDADRAADAATAAGNAKTAAESAKAAAAQSEANAEAAANRAEQTVNDVFTDTYKQEIVSMVVAEFVDVSEVGA